MKIKIALLVATLLLSGCGAGPDKTAHSSLSGHNFILTRVDGQPVTPPAGMKPGISFAQDMHISGVMCNRFFGQGKLEHGVLTVAQLASTRMMCSDTVLNQWEATISKMLTEGARLQLKQQTLTLQGSGHTLVYVSEN